jgi:hypothetical protein
MLNFKAMIAQIDTVVNTNEDRDALVASLSTKKFVGTGQLYAVVTKLFQTQDKGFIPPSHVEWEDQTQNQKDFTVLFTSVGKNLGLIKKA